METLYFDQLNLEEKEELIFDNGYFVSKRDVNDYRVLLYTLDKSYVEVWCRKDTAKIEKIETLKDSEVITSYLEKLDVKKLFLIKTLGYSLN